MPWRKRKRVIRIGLWGIIAAAATSTAACSVAFVNRLPAHPQPGADCTSSYALPAADATAAVLTGALAVTFQSAASDPQNGGANLRTYGWVSAGVAIAAMLSAGYGAYEVNRCRAASKPPAPTHYRENTALPGHLGGKCRPNGSCDGALMCDQPMHTCIPIDDGDGGGGGGGGS